MNRSELAKVLGAATGIVSDPKAGPVMIREADPREFMTSFAQAVAGEGDVFLTDPNWGESERAQLAALLPAPGSASVPQVSSLLRHLRQASVRSQVSGTGWLMIPTGGTSGRLKFARHDEETIAAAVRGFAGHFGLAQVNAVGLLPLYHVSGLMAWMRCALTGGEYRPFDWKAVEAGNLPPLPEKPEGWVLSLVPTQLERLLRSEPAVVWLQSFRILFLGGAPAWPALLEQAAARRLPVSLGYGMTETAAMVTALRPAEFLAGERGNGAALPHASVKIGADDTIVIGGGSLFRGYYPEWRVPGNFETQDRGRLDGRGHLQVLGRRDAVIITGGEKVEPTEVEAVLRATGEFPDIVVLGLPDAEWGQVLVAVYPASNRPDLVRVEQVVKGQLAPAKRPKRFIPLGDWPANAQGKVNRTEVARRVAGGF